MTERTRTQHARPAEQRRAPGGTAEPTNRSGWSVAPNRLRLALLVSVLGAGLVALGPALGLVENAPPPGYAARPLLIALAVVAPLLAAIALWSGRPVMAAGVLIGSALVAPGRALMDAQFAGDALLASRPELMVPTSLTPLPAAGGLWVLLAGHVLVAVAGVLAAGRAGAPGSAYAVELEEQAAASAASGRRYLIGWAFACATVAVFGLLRPNFRSENAFQLTPLVIDSPGLVRAGGLLVTVAVVLGCVFAASSARPQLARGLLLGLLAAVAGVTVPGLVAGLVVDRLGPDLGPYLALGAVGLLVAIVFLLPAPHPRDGDEVSGELRLEPSRLHLAAGLLGLLAGLAALGGGLGEQLVVDAGLEKPASFANRQLVPAAIVVAVLGAALLVRRLAASVRPAFTVALAAVPLAAASALDAALTADAVSPQVRLGVGVWFAVLATILAAAAAACAGIAGSAEREDVDLTEQGTNLAVGAPVAAAVLLAVGAFGLPAVRAPGFVPPGIWSEFRLASWGLVLALGVVVAAAALAPRSRPARAASLLLGAAAVVGVHLLEFPLTGDRAPQATPGQGTWLSLACVATLLIAAFVAVTMRRAPGKSPRVVQNAD